MTYRRLAPVIRKNDNSSYLLCAGRQIKLMGGACSAHEEIINVYKMLV
jgi:hypothetical protein